MPVPGGRRACTFAARPDGSARGRCLSLVAGLLMSCASAISQSAPGATVRTQSGLLQGLADSSVEVFKGIPYAAPPVGPLRWRAPQPPTPWQGVRQASTFSPRCPQIGAYPPEAPQEASSEDCLYLNIWVPRAATASPLPVMVWLHGGALENGSGSLPLYRGDRLAAHGVILVTLNYRLGVLGFLAHPALTRESALHVSGNYGLLDQIAALRWVHRNIAAFGGDPGRVTVFGQSSGSISLSVLTTSPLARGLFQRAIGESGGLFEPVALNPGYSLRGAEAEGVDFAHRAGAPTLEHLRKMSVADLLRIPFNPHLVIDGVALTGSPYDLYARGAQNDVDILIGYNAQEGQLFLGTRSVTPANYATILSGDFPAVLVRVLAPRPGADNATARARAAAFEGDMRFRWDMWTWARLAARTGSRHVYLYRFARAPAFPSSSRYSGMGATHGMEMPYVFGHLDPEMASWSAQDRQLSDTMQAYWTQFARTGNPNSPGLPTWASFRAAPDSAMTLGDVVQMERMRDLGSLRRIGWLYFAVRTVGEHQLASLSVGLAALLAVLAALVLALRSLLRARRIQARTA